MEETFLPLKIETTVFMIKKLKYLYLDSFIYIYWLEQNLAPNLKLESLYRVILMRDAV